MAGDQSFDVVSDFDEQELRNALDQVRREVTQRYDFKGVTVDLEQGKTELLGKAATLVFTVTVARALGPADFGAFSYAVTFGLLLEWRGLECSVYDSLDHLTGKSPLRGRIAGWYLPFLWFDSGLRIFLCSLCGNERESDTLDWIGRIA